MSDHEIKTEISEPCPECQCEDWGDQQEQYEVVDHSLGGFCNPAGDYCHPEDILPVSDGWEDPELA